MKIKSSTAVWLSVLFILGYAYFTVRVNYTVTDYSDIIVATTFFFTLFAGFFITRQNDRYSTVSDLIAQTDGYFSYLYRITGAIPRIQNQMREIIRDHYEKILKSRDWAYHIKHPSNTITRVTKTLESMTKEEADSSEGANLLGNFLYEVVADLQILRKKTVTVVSERLTGLQWTIVYVLGVLLMVSFDLVPSSSYFMDGLKILFGTAVFISILLLHMLDQLTIFGENAAKETAEDILRIVDEKDAAELK